jgi:hypothetical protein
MLRRSATRAERHYRPYPYLHERMGAAFRAADLVVARAGASMLGEAPAFALPSLLVPYPHAWRYQKVNADYLANAGAAIRLDDHCCAETFSRSFRIFCAISSGLPKWAARQRCWTGHMPPRKLAELLLALGASNLMGSHLRRRRQGGRRVISLQFIFLFMIVFFALIGYLRGWQSEVIALSGLVRGHRRADPVWRQYHPPGRRADRWGQCRRSLRHSPPAVLDPGNLSNHDCLL